jgi:Cyclic nucleotide-binding domain
MQKQFTAKRLIGLGLLSAAMLAFIVYMVATYPAEGGTAPTKDEWSRFIPLAFFCIGFVVLADALVTWATFKRQSRLPSEELDPEGAHPDLQHAAGNGQVSLNPIMQSFVDRSLHTERKTGEGSAISRFMHQVPSVLSLQAVPASVVLITAACSVLLFVGSVYYGFPLWGKALALLIPWGPLFTFEAAWKYEHYGFYAFMLVFAVLQVGHLMEHSFQVGQLFLSGGDISVAHGVFGALDRELVHFVWDSLVWVGVGVLLFKLGPHNKWLWIAFIASSFHEVEHIFLFYLDRFHTAFYEAGGTTGILAKGGLIGTPFDRPYLHYVYNFFVVIPLLMALWDETKRAYNIYLAKALPGLTHEERVKASHRVRRIKFEPGEVIFREGEAADKFFVIAKGEVEVFRDVGGGEDTLGTMGPGEFFGELGLLMEKGRTASVRARDEVELLALDREEFSELVATSKGGASDVDRVLPDRLAELAGRATDD